MVVPYGISTPNFRHLQKKEGLGRPPIYDRDQVYAAVKRAVKKKGFPEHGGEPGWQSEADLQKEIGDFLLATEGNEPAKSTLQKLVKEAVEKLKREGR